MHTTSRDGGGIKACFITTCVMRWHDFGSGRAAAVARRPHSMTAEAREHTTLMEIGRAAVARIYDDHARSAARFHDAINQELLQALCTQDCRAA